MTTVEKTFRGISARLALQYLEGMGGRRVEDGVVEGDGWRASVEEGEKVGIGPTVSLTPVHVRFESEGGDLDDVVERFSRKAMRAGG